MRIGLLGLGNMALPAATHLLAAGMEVAGYRRGDMSEFARMGGRPAPSARALGETSDIVVELLPTDDAFESAVLGDQGVLGGVRPGTVLLNLATHDAALKLAAARAAEAKGAAMVEGEISGPPHAMATRTAAFFLAGDRGVVDRVRPVVEAMTERHFYLGDFGAALKMKLVANLLVAVHNLAAAEALALGRKLGIDGRTLLEVLGPSAAGSPSFNYKVPLMLERRFVPAKGSIATLDKYVQLALDAAREAGAHTPLLAAASRYYARAFEAGREHEDTAALIDFIQATH